MDNEEEEYKEEEEEEESNTGYTDSKELIEMIRYRKCIATALQL